jgi:hypothetical protein
MSDYMEIDGVQYLTGGQIALKRNVTPSTVNRWILEGLFPNARKLAFTARGMWIVPRTDYEKAQFPKLGSHRLVKAGKASQAFIKKMTTLLKNAPVGSTHTVGFKVIKKSTAKGHLRTAARRIGKTNRFMGTESETELTFTVKETKEGGAHANSQDGTTKELSAGTDTPTAVDGTDMSERQADRESAVDAA